MEIIISQLLEGAKQAIGLAVIIDVFRAFSLECHLFARGGYRGVYQTPRTSERFSGLYGPSGK